MSGNQDPYSFTIRKGLSAARFAYHTPELASLTKRLVDNFSENQGVRIRHFGAADSDQEPRIPSIRIFKNAEIRRKFDGSNIRAPHQGQLIPIINSVFKAVSYLSDHTPPLRYTAARHDYSLDRRQHHVVLTPDEETVQYLNYERRETLRAIQGAAETKQTEWPTGNFDLLLATTSAEVSQRVARAMSHLVSTHCPIEVTFGPAQFEPDPRAWVQQ